MRLGNHVIPVGVGQEGVIPHGGARVDHVLAHASQRRNHRTFLPLRNRENPEAGEEIAQR